MHLSGINLHMEQTVCTKTVTTFQPAMFRCDHSGIIRQETDIRRLTYLFTVDYLMTLLVKKPGILMELTTLVTQEYSTTNICVAVWAQMHKFVLERFFGRSMLTFNIFPYTCAAVGV